MARRKETTDDCDHAANASTKPLCAKIASFGRKLGKADAELVEVVPLFLRRVFLRWRARARLTQTLAGPRRRSFFAVRRSWWRRVLEDESLRAAILRVLARLLRWRRRGHGLGNRRRCGRLDRRRRRRVAAAAGDAPPVPRV